MLLPLISQIGVPLLTDLVSSSLKKSSNETVQKAGEVLSNLGEEELKEVEVDHDKVQELELKLDQEKFTQINQTYRAEVASSDVFVRRMRPTFGYVMALTWAAQMLAIAYVVMMKPDEAAHVIQAFGALSMIWSVGLSVLGVYVYKRSEEKTGDVSKVNPLSKAVSNLFKENT